MDLIGIDIMAVANIRIPKKLGPMPIAHRVQSVKKIHNKIFAFIMFSPIK